LYVVQAAIPGVTCRGGSDALGAVVAAGEGLGVGARLGIGNVLAEVDGESDAVGMPGVGATPEHPDMMPIRIVVITNLFMAFPPTGNPKLT
jgi:hypothetical protein